MAVTLLGPKLACPRQEYHIRIGPQADRHPRAALYDINSLSLGTPSTAAQMGHQRNHHALVQQFPKLTQRSPRIFEKRRGERKVEYSIWVRILPPSGRAPGWTDGKQTHRRQASPI